MLKVSICTGTASLTSFKLLQAGIRASNHSFLTHCLPPLPAPSTSGQLRPEPEAAVSKPLSYQSIIIGTTPVSKLTFSAISASSLSLRGPVTSHVFCIRFFVP